MLLFSAVFISTLFHFFPLAESTWWNIIFFICFHCWIVYIFLPFQIVHFVWFIFSFRFFVPYCRCPVTKSFWLSVPLWTAACLVSLHLTVFQSLPSSCSLSWWCYPSISSSATLFSFYLQSFPASERFLCVISSGFLTDV